MQYVDCRAKGPLHKPMVIGVGLTANVDTGFLGMGLSYVRQAAHHYPIPSFRTPGVVAASVGLTPPIPDAIPNDIFGGDFGNVVFVDVLNRFLDETIPDARR